MIGGGDSGRNRKGGVSEGEERASQRQREIKRKRERGHKTV